MRACCKRGNIEPDALAMLHTTDAASLEILLIAYEVMQNIEEEKKAEDILNTMQNIAPDDARVMSALLG